MESGLEYIEIAEDIGLPVDEYRELVDDLRELDITVDEHVIPSIRSIERVQPVSCARCDRPIIDIHDEQATPSGSMHSQCAAKYESEKPHEW